jgi:hypothetical protein
MFGIIPVPIYDPKSQYDYISDETMCLFRPGDIVKFRKIDRAEYEAIQAEVAAGRYRPKMAEVTFSLDDFHADVDGTNAKLMGALNG